MLRLLVIFLFLAVNFCCTEGYWDRTCERNTMYLSCNHGVIDVRSAWYGRDRSGVCSERGSTENTNCYTGATSYVSGECDGRSYCSLYVSNSAFGDPCVGTVKYLTVSYRCKTGGRQRLKRICERNWGDIRCYGSDRIDVLSAFYGRKTGGHVCSGSVYTTSCETSAYSYVYRNCDGDQSCSLHAHNHHFGDPCQGTYKYLEVRYRCK